MLIDENQLDEWVRMNARTAQATSVELVWRLVSASCPRPRERRFPLGDSIGQHGPDGVLEVGLAFEPFVPQGRSYWEISATLNAGDKATADYRDLTRQVPESVRRDTTFVFVTPLSGRRDWPYTWKEDAQVSWLEERRKRGEWKDVQIVDGTKLVDWSHCLLPVELWLAEIVSRLPHEHIQTAGQHWGVLRSVGEPPPLTPRLFLANRNEAIAKLKNVLDATSVQLKLTTHYPDQVVDFVSAYVASLDDETRIEAEGRCLIVSATDAWNNLCTNHRGLILVAHSNIDLGGDAGTMLIQKARKANHSVVFSGPQGGIPDPTSVTLPSPQPYEVQEALKEAGYRDESARMLAQRSAGNIGSLLRCIQNLSIMPEWAEAADASELAIAVVLGSWNEDSEADRAAASRLVGKAYGEWIERIRYLALLPATPLIHRDGTWKFIPRYEGWYALGPRLFDDHLDILRVVATTVLTEKDPQFDLPPDRRFAAAIHGKVLSHSCALRNGLAESLALLGSHGRALKSSSPGKAEATAALAVREILAEADWVTWASLIDVLPLLAEAAPVEFLGAVEFYLQRDPCPFDELFAQEGPGVFGRSYMSGLLWALETLAWDPDLLSRVSLILGELAKHDPGGKWTNRPANSLTTIFLPWMPQTSAPIPKRVAAVRTLISEQPDVGWKLLVELLPQHHSASSCTRKPAWRATIPETWLDGVTAPEYWEQVSLYAMMAVATATADVTKLVELIDNLENLTPTARERLLAHLVSDEVLTMPEVDRHRIWSQLVSLATKHRKFTDAEWSMEPAQVDGILDIANRLKPSRPFFIYQRLFTEREFELYTRNGDYDTQRKELEDQRSMAVSAIAKADGPDALVDFARAVESPWRVGIAFGQVASRTAEGKFLPRLLESDERALTQFAGGFVWGRFHVHGWAWVDTIDLSEWTPSQIGSLLAFLPFTEATWKRVGALLGQDKSHNYWSKTSANPYQAEGNLELAADELMNHQRPFAAIDCLHKMLLDNKRVDAGRAARALLLALQSPETPNTMDVHETVEIIKALQNDASANPDDLFKVEWAYLPILHRQDASPRLLSRRLADAPRFFCEVVRLVFRPRLEDAPTDEPTEEKKTIATNAYTLLREWRLVPGRKEDGSFSAEAFSEWLASVKNECADNEHLEIALTLVGHVLAYSPPDPDGLWIHRAVAEALNAKEAGDMRDGFRTELFNSRGVHWVDPTGKPERELAERYEAQAEAVEMAGYPRLASTLLALAKDYEREAKRISSREAFED